MEKDVTTVKNHDTISNTNIMPGFTSRESYQLLWNMATMFSRTSLVPETFRGDTNIGNCAVAINMAKRMGADPLMIMQNLYVVHGNPAWSSKFMIATFNQCGKYSSIHYDMVGKPDTDEYGCRAWAAEKDTGERIDGPLVTIGIAKKEGWYAKKMSKWPNIPDQMLRYRAAAWFIRTTAPELSMGLQTVDEVRDSIEEKDITPSVQKPSKEIADNMASETIDAPKSLPKTKEKVKPNIPVASAEKVKMAKSEPAPAENAAIDNLPDEPDF